MRDLYGKELSIGQIVSVNRPHYRGLIKAEIVSFTPKKVRVEYGTKGHSGRQHSYLVDACDVALAPMEEQNWTEEFCIEVISAAHNILDDKKVTRAVYGIVFKKLVVASTYGPTELAGKFKTAIHLMKEDLKGLKKRWDEEDLVNTLKG